MTVLVTTGHALSGFGRIHALLAGSGLQAPSGRFADALGRRLTPLRHAGVAGVDAAEEALRDAYRSASQVSGWGWAQPATEAAPDFWADMDPDIRFVLVYAAPAATLGFGLMSGASAVDDIEAALRAWRDCNGALLQFYHRHAARCILVHERAALENPQELLALLSGPLGVLPAGATAAATVRSPPEADLEAAAAEPWLARDRAARLLYAELESIAHLPGDGAEVQAAYAEGAWQGYRSLQSRTQALSALEAQEAQSALAAAQSARMVLQEQCDALRAELGAVSAENDAVRAENALLLLQLQQVQEELDSMATPVQPAAPAATRPGTSAASDIVTIDMRAEIDGDNWYYAEHDGRWAGPGAVSSVRFSRMPEGRYQLRLDVVDAIDKKILADMAVFMNGLQLKMKQDGRGVAAVLTGQFSTKDISGTGPLQLELRFNKLISPAQRGSADSRMLAIRLRSVSVARLA